MIVKVLDDLSVTEGVSEGFDVIFR